MSSAGDAIDKLCHIVRLTMEIRGTDFDGAVAELGPVVPDGMTDKMRQRMLHDSTVLLRPGLPDRPVRGWAAGLGDYDPSAGYYWLRLRAYLTEAVDRRAPEVDALDTSTDMILRHLPPPGRGAPFGTRGLVLGHVQSGKTGNFSALIAKAADASYRIVIVL